MSAEAQVQVTRAPAGEIIATGVSEEEYLEKYAAHFCEWVDGDVIKMSPVRERHDMITRFLAILFEVYFELKPMGRIRQAPFVMSNPITGRSREPDLQVILNTNPGDLTETRMIGAADICIEVVSPESVERDHGDKFAEYEKGGVPEYWIMDPLRDECRFYRLDDGGRYLRQTEDSEGSYRTLTLPGLVLHVPTLWGDALPGPIAIGEAVQKMLRE